MKEFHRNLEQYQSNLWSIPAHKKFFSKCIKIYYFFPLLLGTVTIGYLMAAFRKSPSIKFPILKLLGVLGSCFFFIMALHIGSPNTSYRFYAEVNYLPLMIIVGIPFTFDFAANIKKGNWLLGSLVIVMIIRLNTIATNHKKFETRHDWYTNQMQLATKKGTNRSAIYTSKTPKHLVIQPWASAHETLLLSSLEGPEASKSFLIYENGTLPDKHRISNPYFITFFQAIHIDQMNSNYFQLGEGAYLIQKE